MLWLGVRSYGFYLWNWPVIALSRPGLDVPLQGTPLILLQLAVTLLLADLSYRFVEQPFRRRSGSPAAPRWLPRARPALAVAVVAAVVVVGWSGLASGGGSGVASASGRSDGGTTVIVRGGRPGLNLGRPGAVARGPNAYPAAILGRPDRVQPPDRGDAPVFAVGDSVMKAAALALADRVGGRIVVNADEGRAPIAYAGVIAAHASAKGLPDDVIVQMGNNGPIYDADLKALKAALAGVDHVYLVNVEVPRSWEGEVNDTLAAAVDSWPEARLIDWRDAIDAHLDLTYDGIHPDPEGAKIYAGLILDALRVTGARPEPAGAAKRPPPAAPGRRR